MILILFTKALFRQKLQLCCYIYDFDDQNYDAKGKEQKRETLVELAEYINTPVGQKILTEAAMPDIAEMVRVNLFRTLPPQTEDFDPEEDEPAMELMWPHLQVSRSDTITVFCVVTWREVGGGGAWGARDCEMERERERMLMFLLFIC